MNIILPQCLIFLNLILCYKNFFFMDIGIKIITNNLRKGFFNASRHQFSSTTYIYECILLYNNLGQIVRVFNVFYSMLNVIFGAIFIVSRKRCYHFQIFYLFPFFFKVIILFLRSATKYQYHLWLLLLELIMIYKRSKCCYSCTWTDHYNWILNIIRKLKWSFFYPYWDRIIYLVLELLLKPRGTDSFFVSFVFSFVIGDCHC